MKIETKSLPRGPKGHPITGCATDFKTNPLDFMMRCRNEFGNIVPIDFGPFPVVLLNEPDLLYQVLVAQSQNFTKDAALKNNRAFFGNGLLSSEGDYWKRQKKLASPAFNHKHLASYGQIMIEHTQRLISKWQDGQSFDIQHEMMLLTLGIACKTLFDTELSDENHELENALTKALVHLNERMNMPLLLMLPEWIPFPTNTHLLEAIRVIDKVIFKLIKERKNEAEGRQDLLSILVAARDEDDNSPMTDQQIRDEIFTFFFAGHETTALTLSWTLHLLATNPATEEHLLEEIKQVLNGRAPTAADYNSLPYTEKVIKESMRVRPPVWGIGREAAIDCNLDGYFIKKGTAILMSPWLMHQESRYYENPQLFNPERWNEQFSQTLPKFAYFPFGGGPRTCIGNGFAMLEAALVLTTIVQDWRLEMTAGDTVEQLPAVTLRAAHGIQMTARKR